VRKLPRTVVVAIGGNSLLREAPLATIAEQFDAARKLSVHLQRMLANGWRVVVTHGNGPQVGFILRRSELVAAIAPELPRLDLDMCVADSQGSVGYILASTLASESRRAGRPGDVVALLTHTVVDRHDPAFSQPTKPIGSFYTEQAARLLAEAHGWAIAEDSGRGWRRIVPSPRPQRIVEERAITTLLSAGYVVIAAGGGGIPVVEAADGSYRGVEAVIDKDSTAALLASVIGADLLVITTSVSRVAVNFGRPDQRFLDVLEAGLAERLLSEGQFPPGSMGPKVQAALKFADTGGEVLITSPDQLSAALEGQSGTWLLPAGQRSRRHWE
jgi:carbamate kinase